VKVRVPIFLKIFLLAVITGVSVLFFSYHLAYAKKVIPGVRIADTTLGNKNQVELRAVLAVKFNSRSSKPVRLFAGERNFEFSLEELGLIYDLDQTTAAALAVGRSGNIFEDLEIEVRAWFEGVEIAPVLRTENEKLDAALLKVAEELDDPPVEAAFKIKDGELVVTEAASGRLVDREGLEEEIFDLLKVFSKTAIEISLEEVVPEITDTDLETVKPQIEELLANPVKLVYQLRSWAPTSEELLSLLEFKKEGPDVTVLMNRASAEEYIGGIAGQVNRAPRGDLFRAEGARVVEFRLASNGLALDQEDTARLLSEALFGLEKEVELPVEVSEAPRAANEYGIKELLGQGVSNFSGSSQGRVNNIKTASAKLQGVLIAPGETFSFNGVLGEVTAATGYDTAWIISQGRTILGVGGGVCQVSTTVFRAAFNSGLEILQRAAHAYRVHYYEPPLGFDATVYSPSPDLVFKNDTVGHILIWAYIDVPNTTLTFNFYGTSDGRSTKMIGPFVSNESPPPAPLYQEDASLAKGVTQQVDWAAWGATAVLKREVRRDGELLHNDTFVSNYRPWQAVFLVGP